MADISNIKPVERPIEIKSPVNGAPLGIRVTVMSIEDERLKRIKREITDESLRLQSRNKHFKMADIEANENRILFAASLGWEWYNPTGAEGDEGYDPDAMPDFHGEQPEFNQKNFMAVIKELSWFAGQLRNEIDEEKAFFNDSKSN